MNHRAFPPPQHQPGDAVADLACVTAGQDD